MNDPVLETVEDGPVTGRAWPTAGTSRGSASAVCRLRRHLVAVAVRRVLRDKRSGNAAPQLLSIDAPFHSELSGNVTAPGFAGSPLRGAVPGFTPPGGGANSLFHSAGAAASGRHGLRRDCLPPPLSPAFGVRPDRPGNAASVPYVNRCHVPLASKSTTDQTPAEQGIASAAPTAIPSTAPPHHAPAGLRRLARSPTQTALRSNDRSLRGRSTSGPETSGSPCSPRPLPKGSLNF